MALEKRILLAVSLFALISTLNGFDIIDCGSKKGKFNNVQISGCDITQNSCNLHRGTNASVKIEFVPSENANGVKTVIHGIIDTIPVPFPLQNPDACVDSGIQCPLKAGTTYDYQAMLPVERKYPKISLKVKWELQDENGNDIICLIVPAKVV